jgi:ABC-type Fe3+/spermidine/putrescine transport system ATPase subunit
MGYHKTVGAITMPKISLKGITKYFGRVKALENINLEINEGEYLFIIGPSGCGKTTLINCITGIIQPTKGNIYFNGKNVQDLSIEERHFAMVFQNIALFPHMSVEQNVTYGPFVDNLKKEMQNEIGEEMLELVDLLEQKKLYPRALSGGAQQKTALARALATKEKLLILDEPISALDYKVRVTLRYEIQHLVKKLGLTAIHITHDQEEAMSIADRIVIMRAGEIIEIGTPEQLYVSPKNLFTMNFVGESNFLEGMIIDKQERDTYVIEFRNKQIIQIYMIEKDFDLHDSVIMAFRPETASFVNHDKKNSLEGKILNRRFMGGMYRYDIKLSTDDDVIVDSNFYLQEKEKLFIYPDPKKVQLFSSPEFGLDKVLKLE